MDNIAELWNSTIVQVVFWTTVLMLLLALAFSIMRRFRDSAVSDSRRPLTLLANFQEMRDQGDINDAEYRTIHSLLQTPAGNVVKKARENAYRSDTGNDSQSDGDKVPRDSTTNLAASDSLGEDRQ